MRSSILFQSNRVRERFHVVPAQSGRRLSDLLADIPLDAGATMLYALVLEFGYLDWHGGGTSGHNNRRTHPF